MRKNWATLAYLISVICAAFGLSHSYQQEKALSYSRLHPMAQFSLVDQTFGVQGKSPLLTVLKEPQILRDSLAVASWMEGRVQGGYWTPRRVNEMALFIVLKAREYKLSPFLILSVIEVESSFRTQAVSPKGAVGLMQLMPATAREVATGMGLPESFPLDLRDPKINVALGSRYLVHLINNFKSNHFALAAYNMGPAAFRRRLVLGGKLPHQYYEKVIGIYLRIPRAREHAERNSIQWL